MVSKSTLVALLACEVVTNGINAAETPANCDTSETTGCLNGNAYNHLDKKPCGNAVYDRATVVSYCIGCLSV